MKTIRHLGRLAVVAGLSAVFAAPAASQSFNTWRATSSAGVCGVQTTNSMQSIPTGGFGFFSDRRDRFQIMMSGYMSTDTPPGRGEVVFANRTAPMEAIQFTRVPSGNSLLDDTFRLTVHLDTEYLRDVAESESFLIRFDGNDFAPFQLSERGQAVAYMARCMSEMAR
jgi:hypothetical protein